MSIDTANLLWLAVVSLAAASLLLLLTVVAAATWRGVADGASRDEGLLQRSGGPATRLGSADPVIGPSRSVEESGGARARRVRPSQQRNGGREGGLLLPCGEASHGAGWGYCQRGASRPHAPAVGRRCRVGSRTPAPKVSSLRFCTVLAQTCTCSCTQGWEIFTAFIYAKGYVRIVNKCAQVSAPVFACSQYLLQHQLANVAHSSIWGRRSRTSLAG